MAIRDILIIPEKKLRLNSEPVKPSTSRCARWSRTCSRPCTRPRHRAGRHPDRRAAAADHPGPGQENDPPEPYVFINPGYLVFGRNSTYEEGCLSIPEYYEEVERPAKVKVKYLDLDGKPQEIEADGLLATCLQHEIDHINGVLFIDHISKLKRAW